MLLSRGVYVLSPLQLTKTFRIVFTFGGTVRVTWFNSESDPPPDLEPSTTPEERADNLLCIPP